MYIADFLEAVNTGMLSDDEGYRDGQFGRSMVIYEYDMPDLAETDIIIVGCPEYRGRQPGKYQASGPDNVRSHLYSMYYWHPEIRIADIGNIKHGATLSDTYAALKTVVGECMDAGKTVIILGGSHDLTLAQYYAYSDRGNIIEAVCVDAQIDIDVDSRKREASFLMEMLPGEPNYIRQYNHIAFQSYYVHPHMLQTMDKLEIKINVQPTMNAGESCCEIIENISNKYRLLCQQEVVIRLDEFHQTIQLPLITQKELEYA